MGRLLLEDAVLLDPEASAASLGSLLIEDGRIAARLRRGDPIPEDARRVDLAGRKLAPGFIDLHFHGSMIFEGPEGFGSALRRDGAALLQQGTTAYLATTVAWSSGSLARNVSRLVAEIAEIDQGIPDSALPLGLHLEGPWIHPGAAGAQPGSGIRRFDPAEGADVLDRGEGGIHMVTLAPEVEGGSELLGLLASRGIVAALGHSLADAASVESAVERGARHVTHLFNAMGSLHHRAPGLVGVALADDRLSCDLICDGAHVDPRMTRVAARAKGDRLCLITDRIDPGGPAASSAAAASFGSGKLHDDGVALRLEDGRLAGSLLSLDVAIANAQLYSGMTQLEAVAACTLRPARVLGVEAQRGTLRPGARADFAVLDTTGRVVETWLGGERVYASENPPGSSARLGDGV
jgi:N-acetylglucosamine-6-phosphate deacetylase